LAINYKRCAQSVTAVTCYSDRCDTDGGRWKLCELCWRDFFCKERTQWNQSFIKL